MTHSTERLLLTRFSRGEVSAMQVRGLLGDITFGDLLMRLGTHGLPLPRTPLEGREDVIRRLRAALFAAP